MAYLIPDFWLAAAEPSGGPPLLKFPTFLFILVSPGSEGFLYRDRYFALASLPYEHHLGVLLDVVSYDITDRICFLV